MIFHVCACNRSPAPWPGAMSWPGAGSGSGEIGSELSFVIAGSDSSRPQAPWYRKAKNSPVNAMPDVVLRHDAAMTSTFAFAGANVLVAGASGGLGSHFVQQLTAAGAHVTAVGRDPARLAALGLSPERTLALDLRLPATCATAANQAAQHGPIDLVVTATGVVAFGTVGDMTVDVMEELFLTNVFVPIMLSQAVLGHMAPGGVLVNISGVIAEQNLPGMVTYGASKAALRSFQEGFAREARRQKVRVLDARPPHTETGLADRALEGEAPKFAPGLEPASVVATILEAVASGAKDLPSTAFAP